MVEAELRGADFGEACSASFWCFMFLLSKRHWELIQWTALASCCRATFDGAPPRDRDSRPCRSAQLDNSGCCALPPSLPQTSPAPRHQGTSQQGQALQYHPACCLPWLPKRQSHSPSGTSRPRAGNSPRADEIRRRLKAKAPGESIDLPNPRPRLPKRGRLAWLGATSQAKTPSTSGMWEETKDQQTDRQWHSSPATTLGRITSISKPLSPPPAARTRPPQVSLSGSIKRQPRPGGRSWIKCSRVVTPPLVPATAGTQRRVNSGWMARRPAQK